MPPSAPPRQWSPRVKARWSACLLIAALALGVGEWLARQDAARARAEAGESQLQVTRRLAERLSQEMAARAHDVQRLAELDVLRPVQDPAAARTALERVKSSLSSSAWIGVTNPEGTVIASTGDVLLGQSVAAHPVFQNGIQRIWTGDVHEVAFDPAGEAAKFIDMAAPIRTPDGTALGVVALQLYWQPMHDARGAAPSLQWQIVNSRGDVLPPAGLGSLRATLAPARIHALGERWGLETWSDGREAVTSVSESRSLDGFRGHGWHVVARDVNAAAVTSVQAARGQAHGRALGAGALAALIACWVIGRVTAPAEPASPSPQQPPAPPVSGGARPQRRNDVHPMPVAIARKQVTPKDRDAPHAAPVDAAHRDALTGLWNRGHLPDASESLRTSMADGTSETCVLCVDLDGFQEVNERYGHGAGDEVLTQVARRLRQAARAGDAVFRIGGDEFLILVTCPRGEAATLARNIAGRVLAELHRPLHYRTLSNLRVSASVGGATWPAVEGESLADAIGHADEALHAAKLSGRSMFRLYAGATAPQGAGAS